MGRRVFVAVIFTILNFSEWAFAAKGEWSLTTDLKLESLYWPQKYGVDTNNTLNRLQLIPTVTGKYGDSIRLFFKPEFFWDPQNKSDEEKVFINPGEAYFKYKTPTTSVQAGSHVLNWGVTDAYNPLDVVNQRQYFDPLHAKKIGAWSLLFSHGTEHSEQELIYIPRNQTTLLPGTNSRWLPREIYIPRSVDNNVILLLPDDIRYTYVDRVSLNNALDNNVGLRLQWHFNGIDIGLTGFDGASIFPIVQPEVTGNVISISPYIVIQTDSEIKLHLKNYRQKQAGFSWVSSQLGFLFKYAGSYSLSYGDDPLLPGWTQENVVALEKNFNIGSDGLLVAVLQYSYIRDQKENDSNLSILQVFRRAWMLGARFSWGDNWTATVSGLYDSLNYSSFQEYSVGRRLFDTWTLQASADFIAGHDYTPLGIYNSNDYYGLSISRSF
jgi:hypothetical protein